MAQVFKDPEVQPETKPDETKTKTSTKKVTGLYPKILSVMETVGGYVQKDKVNREQKYTYVSEGAVLAKVQPALIAAKLIALPHYDLISSEDKATAKGSIWKLITVSCRLKLIDAETGESDEVIAIGQGLDSGDKAVAKAQTMAFKYAWWKLLCLETGDDPEADPVTDNQQFSNPQQQVPQQLSQSQQQELEIMLGNPPMVELLKMWNFAGWDPAALQDYVLKRLNKTSFDGVTPSEYTAVINDLASYMQSQGMKVMIIPF